MQDDAADLALGTNNGRFPLDEQRQLYDFCIYSPAAASYRGLNYGPGLADFMQLNLTSYDRADEFSIQPFHSYVQM